MKCSVKKTKQCCPSHVEDENKTLGETNEVVKYCMHLLFAWLLTLTKHIAVIACTHMAIKSSQ